MSRNSIIVSFHVAGKSYSAKLRTSADYIRAQIADGHWDKLTAMSFLNYELTRMDLTNMIDSLIMERLLPNPHCDVTRDEESFPTQEVNLGKLMEYMPIDVDPYNCWIKYDNGRMVITFTKGNINNPRECGCKGH